MIMLRKYVSNITKVYYEYTFNRFMRKPKAWLSVF